MPTFTPSDLAIPAADQVFALGDDANGAKLKQALVIGAPSSPETTPPSLTFDRKRDVEIPWDTIFREVQTEIKVTVDPIRVDFERSVGAPGRALEFIDDTDIKLLSRHYTALGEPAGEGNPAKVFRPSFPDVAPDANGLKVEAEPVEEGVLFWHGSGRIYRLIPAEDLYLNLKDFATPSAYQKTWADRIVGSEPVYATEAEAIDGASGYEEIDLTSGYIETRMQELLEMRRHQRAFGEKAEVVIEQMLENAVARNLDIDELERIQSRAVQIKLGQQRIETRIKRLVNQASDLGYILADKDMPAEAAPDGKGTEVKAGTLYRRVTRLARWTTEDTVSRVLQQTLWLMFVRIKTQKIVKVPRKTAHKKVVNDVEQVDTSRDLLAEKMLALREAGYVVHIFRTAPQGYMSDQGMTLDAIMAECGRDERARLTCAAILPTFETSMTGRRALTGYKVFTKPMPGIQPVAMPRLSLVESLSYRLAWAGTQIGELVNALNIAPGEERMITMRKEYESETTITQSRSSVFDIERQESSDLSSEMENEMSTDASHSDETAVSATASGSYGPFSASASASHGSKNSLKSFAKSLGKVAKKSAQSVNSKQKEEVSSSSTSRTTVTSFDETTAKIENINQGRTLNLMFYRLFNRFRSGLFLEGLRFEVLSSTEVIAGSGIRRTRQFGFDSFADMVDEFGASSLPIAIGPGEKYHYLGNVVQVLHDTILAEYKRPEGRKAAGPATASVDMLSLSAPMTSKATAAPRAAVADPELEQALAREVARGKKEKSRIDALRARAAQAQKALAAFEDRRAEVAEILKGATIDDNTAIPNTGQELLIVAPGLYLDSTLGVQPATEDYSEQMRAQRIRSEAADVAVKYAEAQYKMSLANRLQGKGAPFADNWITGIMADEKSCSIRVKLKFPVTAGEWTLFIDGTPVKARRTAQISEDVVEVRVNRADADLVARDDLMTRQIELRDGDAGRLITTA